MPHRLMTFHECYSLLSWFVHQAGGSVQAPGHELSALDRDDITIFLQLDGSYLLELTHKENP